MVDEIEEIMDEATVGHFSDPKLPEAPASANTRVKTKAGRQWQITMRTDSMSNLVKQIEAMDNLFESKGWAVPQWQAEDDDKVEKKDDKEWTGDNCPKCNGRLYKLTTKTGKNANKCENNKWDFKTKKAVGCDYIEWI